MGENRPSLDCYMFLLRRTATSDTFLPMEPVMRKNPNMVLRGASWYLRVAVPKRLQASEPSRASVAARRFGALESGDAQTAKSECLIN